MKVRPSPPCIAVVKSPLNLKLKFESFGGSKIDPDTVKVIYLKSPAIDLTQRLKKHIRSDGIELDTADVQRKAELAAGEEVAPETLEEVAGSRHGARHIVI